MCAADALFLCGSWASCQKSERVRRLTSDRSDCEIWQGCSSSSSKLRTTGESCHHLLVNTHAASPQRRLHLLADASNSVYSSWSNVHWYLFWSYKWDWSVCCQSLEKLNMWGVDIFHIAKHSNNRPLTAVVFTILEVGYTCTEWSKKVITLF